MVSLTTTLKSGFITDLTIPPPGTQSLTADHLSQLSLDVALALLHDLEAFIRSSPLVTNVARIHPGHAKYIDVRAFCQLFDLELHPDYVVDEEGGAEWVQYEITDKLSVLYAFSTEIVYYTAMRRTKSGFESVTNPGNGVRIHGKFDVVKAAPAPAAEQSSVGGGGCIAERTSEATAARPQQQQQQQQQVGLGLRLGGEGEGEAEVDGVINFVEHNETRCNVFLAQYIKATTGSSHRAMHERFKERWNEEMKRRLDGYGEVR